MKTSRSVALLAAFTLAVLASTPRVRAQAEIDFSGGNDAPLELTIDAPITYVVDVAPTAQSPLFDFQGVGDIFAEKANVTGTITFTINGGAPVSIINLNSGLAEGSVAANDDYIYGMLPGLEVGDIVVLSAGTLTTTGDFEDAPPASGSYPTFLFENDGTRLDTVDGVSIPEPSTWALLLAGTVLVALLFKRGPAPVAA